MKDSFSNYHPLVNFSLLISLIIFSMFFMNPILLMISYVSALIYSLYIQSIKSIKSSIIIIIIFTIINPIFNEEGNTILLIILNHKITLESVSYGIASGIMFSTVILWFGVLSKIMTSDKTMYIFGKVAPSISLTVCMIFKLIPDFKNRIKEIDRGQKALGNRVDEKGLIEKIKYSLNIVFILLSWCFESALETADSMKARGFGLKHRTSYYPFRFKKCDKILMIIVIILDIIIIYSWILGKTTIQFFPHIEKCGKNPYTIVSYGILCLIPLIVNIQEVVKWKLLK